MTTKLNKDENLEIQEQIEQQSLATNTLHKANVVKLNDGSYKRVKEYHQYISHKPNSDEEEVELFNLMNGTLSMTPFKSMMNKEITIDKLYIFPYDSINKETGELKQDVRIILKDDGNGYYVTSSKTVYKSLENLISVFTLETRKIVVKVIETDSNQTSRKLVDVQLVKSIER